jgi:hypothetical protein
MDMKDHILAALSEQFERWEALLASLNEAQITAPDLPSGWSIKDVIAHLMAWQQRSIARVEAARLEQKPEFPVWLPGVDPEDYDNTNQINAWIDAAYRELPWPAVHLRWKEGFKRFLVAGAQISEKDLLDSSRYPWLDGYPLANIFLATYDHHQEHIEKLRIGSEDEKNLDLPALPDRS